MSRLVHHTIPSWSSADIFALPFDEWHATLKTGDVIVLTDQGDTDEHLFMWPLRESRERHHNGMFHVDLVIPLHIGMQFTNVAEYYRELIAWAHAQGTLSISIETLVSAKPFDIYKLDRNLRKGIVRVGYGVTWLAVQPTDSNRMHKLTNSLDGNTCVGVEAIRQDFEKRLAVYLQPSFQFVAVIKGNQWPAVHEYVGRSRYFCTRKLDVTVDDSVFQYVFDEPMTALVVDCTFHTLDACIALLRQKFADLLVDIIYARMDHCFLHSIPDNEEYTHITHMWKHLALDRRPWQHLLLTNLVLSIGDYLPLYVMMEIVKLVPGMNLWTPLAIVRFLEPIYAQIRHIRSLRGTVAGSTRSRTTPAKKK